MFRSFYVLSIRYEGSPSMISIAKFLFKVITPHILYNGHHPFHCIFFVNICLISSCTGNNKIIHIWHTIVMQFIPNTVNNFVENRSIVHRDQLWFVFVFAWYLSNKIQSENFGGRGMPHKLALLNVWCVYVVLLFLMWAAVWFCQQLYCRTLFLWHAGFFLFICLIFAAVS